MWLSRVYLVKAKLGISISIVGSLPIGAELGLLNRVRQKKWRELNISEQTTITPNSFYIINHSNDGRCLYDFW